MMSFSQIADVLKGRIKGQNVPVALAFDGVAIDTRKNCEAKLFIALKGDNYDAHDYLDQAEKAGASALVLERDVESSLPTILVKDTHVALKELAAWWRLQHVIPVIGITGSVGKTTVKEMVGSIFAELGQGVVTEGNLNNEIGLPLTVLRLNQSDQYAVLEMGMNHAGEIYRLSHIAQPTIALVNNAAAAHLEGLGSVAAVAEAKGEIFSGLADDGVAIINLDDDFAGRWIELAGKRGCVTFSLKRAADITAKVNAIEPKLQLTVSAFNEHFDVTLNTVGSHNAYNALAAIAISVANGLSSDKIITGLQNFTPIKGRLVIQEMAGRHIIDDTYNANPASMRAAINVLSEFDNNTLIVGDMGELGDAAEQEHIALGQYAASHGIDKLIACGDYAQAVAKGFGDQAETFTTQADLIRTLAVDSLGAAILVKGSRSAQMEQVVEAIKAQLNSNQHRGNHVC